MKHFIILTSLFIFTGCASTNDSSNQTDAGEWWVVDGYEGTCTNNVGDNYWLSPNNLIEEYGCKIMPEVEPITGIRCTSGELMGNSFSFTKSRKSCEFVAKLIAESKL
ncbi:hypothetical protein [Shewanella woodyi]|uniref:hypothetical protein n=1 Tax=Shewanella woodyi TaxID=60961 RepID=UPI00374A16C3